jgi:DnaK suppressor protein
MLSQEFLNEIKNRLEEEKKQVEAKIAALQTPEETMENPSLDELAQDAEEDYLEESLLSVHKNILERINDALYRLKDGTFGRCIECGAEISEEDLRAEPWAEHCRACKK